MVRSKLRELVIANTGRSDKESLINDALDLAVAEVSSQRSWSDLLTEAEATMTASVGYVALASTMARLSEVRVLDGTLTRPLIVRDKTWILERYPYPDQQPTVGRPVYAYLTGQTLYTVPWPDSGYTLRYTYYRLHPALTTDASTVLIRHADPVVIAYATFWVFQSIEKPLDADRWLKTYFALLNSAKKVDADNSAVRRNFTIRGQDVPAQPDYWLDPFVRQMP